MTRIGWPLLIIIALCACLAIGCGAYLLSGGNDIQLIVAIVSVAAGVGFIAAGTALYLQSNSARGYLLQLRNDMRTADRSYRESYGRVDYLAQQVLEMRNRGEQINTSITAGFGELKAGYASLAEQMRELSKKNSGFGSEFGKTSFLNGFGKPSAEGTKPFQQTIFGSGQTNDQVFGKPAAVANKYTPGFHAELAAQAAATTRVPHEDYATVAATSAQDSFVDRLSTSLEPIVDLFTGKTTHYRLHLGMARDDGEEVPSDTVLHHADRTGLRAGFDLHAARDALQLLQRLRQRDPGLRIFQPIGAQTLQSEETVARILELLAQYDDVANGLVFEIPHAMLAGLSDTGLEGLAKFARGGHTLSLANISAAGVDLHSLSKLNVRYVSMNVSAATGLEGPSRQILDFAQTARSLRVHVVVTNVVDQRTVAGISKITRFASGPVFAEPRRVRSDATNSRPTSYSNVA